MWATSQNPKVMVQGKHYMTFVALVLPKIALSLGKEEILIKEIMEENKVEEDDSTDMVTEKKKDEVEVPVVKATKESEPQAQGKIKPPEEKETPNNTSASHKVNPVSESDGVNSTVERLQKGVEERLQLMTNQLEASIKLQQSAEAKIEELTKKVEVLNNNVEEVKVKVIIVEKVASETSKEVKQMAASCPEVLKLEEDFKKQKEAVDKILNIALNMEKKLNNLREKYSSPELKEKQVSVEDDIIEVAEKKGIMFTSSVALPLRLDEIEKATDSNIKKVKTYRVIENKTATDPDLHLNNVMILGICGCNSN